MLLPEFCEELFYISSNINLFESTFKIYLKKVFDYNILETQKWLKRLNKNYTTRQLKELKQFNLSNNQLTSFPNLKFPNLSYISLFNNQLTSISLNLQSNLRHLDLGNNQLTSISLNLPNLKALHLFNNMLMSILNITLDVPKLQFLFISNNQSIT